MPIQNNYSSFNNVDSNTQNATVLSIPEAEISADDVESFNWLFIRTILKSKDIPRLFFDTHPYLPHYHPYPMTYISENGLTPIRAFASKAGASGILFDRQMEKNLVLGAKKNMFTKIVWFPDAIFKGGKPNVHECIREEVKSRYDDKRRICSDRERRHLPRALTNVKHIKQKLEEIEYRRSGRIPDVSSKYQLVALLESLCQQADQKVPGAVPGAKGRLETQFDTLKERVLNTPEGNQHRDINGLYKGLIESITHTLPEAHLRLSELAPALEKVEDPSLFRRYLKKAFSAPPAKKYFEKEKLNHNEQIVYASTEYVSGISVNLSPTGLRSTKKIYEQLNQINKITDLQKLLYLYLPECGLFMLGDINALTLYDTMIKQSQGAASEEALTNLFLKARILQKAKEAEQQEIVQSLFIMVRKLGLRKTLEADLIDSLYFSTFKAPRPTNQECKNNVACTAFIQHRLEQAKRDAAYAPFRELKHILEARSDLRTQYIKNRVTAGLRAIPNHILIVAIGVLLLPVIMPQYFFNTLQHNQRPPPPYW